MFDLIKPFCRRAAVLVPAFVVLACLGLAPGAWAAAGESKFVPGELLVKGKAGVLHEQDPSLRRVLFRRAVGPVEIGARGDVGRLADRTVRGAGGQRPQEQHAGEDQDPSPSQEQETRKPRRPWKKRKRLHGLWPHSRSDPHRRPAQISWTQNLA